ncbi:hypothetical protein ON010_g9569 [Phytophthora cinnamomi]|nr:hypothetical protein ON010_g9569 [Phytophthora cinnamomi]
MQAPTQSIEGNAELPGDVRTLSSVLSSRPRGQYGKIRPRGTFAASSTPASGRRPGRFPTAVLIGAKVAVARWLSSSVPWAKRQDVLTPVARLMLLVEALWISKDRDLSHQNPHTSLEACSGGDACDFPTHVGTGF